MDESDYVWRPAFLDEINKGDVVQIQVGDPRTWTVTGTRYETREGKVSIIGVDAAGNPQGYIAEYYRPVLRREYAIPQVFPDGVPHGREFAELLGHLLDRDGHGLAAVEADGVDDLLAIHDRQYHGANEGQHVHEQEPETGAGFYTQRADDAAFEAETGADRLREADLESQEILELPHFDGEALLAHLCTTVSNGGHEFEDSSVEEIIGGHGTLQGRHDHDHSFAMNVDLTHVHSSAPDTTAAIDPSDAETVVILK